MKETAIKIVKNAFEGKVDKGGKQYIDHLLRVANNASIYTTTSNSLESEELYVVGLLHDLLEDCPEWSKTHLQSIFGDDVADAVELLTRTSVVNSTDFDYDQYINNIKENKLACAVKLADLKDNMNLNRLDDITEYDIKRTIKYYKSYCFLSGTKPNLSDILNEYSTTNGIKIIQEERIRQIKEEGHSINDDVIYTANNDLSLAGAFYAMSEKQRVSYLIKDTDPNIPPLGFPWDSKYWKPTPNDRIRELAKAGALIAAEIDRLLALSKK